MGWGAKPHVHEPRLFQQGTPQRHRK
jgi:hypothetical protein